MPPPQFLEEVESLLTVDFRRVLRSPAFMALSCDAMRIFLDGFAHRVEEHAEDLFHGLVNWGRWVVAAAFQLFFSRFFLCILILTQLLRF